MVNNLFLIKFYMSFMAVVAFLQDSMSFTVQLVVSSSAYQCPHYWGTGLPYGLHIRRTGHNPPRGPSTGWWVLTTANAAGTNGFTCLPKHGGARDNTFLVTHPMTGQRCLTSAIDRAHWPSHRAHHCRSWLHRRHAVWLGVVRYVPL
jgi:hypothetical protein